LEKFNYNRKHMRKLILDNNEVVTDGAQILSEAVKFYSSLYQSSNVNLDDDNVDYFFNNDNIPRLSEFERDSCEEVVTIEECYESMSSCKVNKSPGNDGLTKEFYDTFWDKLSKPLLECFRFSFEAGTLSNSQRQAIITLIDKHGKDRSYLSNWRPISLLNLDYKILTKVLANRVKKVLPSIISSSQTGYVKDRCINDSVRLVQDIIHISELNKSPGILLMVDFQKAFDTIEWEFIEHALKRFHFGPTFSKWVKIIYKEISSCIYNNATTSSYFTIHRGVRQGDPLSPYLFIIAVEILAYAIKENKNITGIDIKCREIKLTQYADDLTLTLSDIKSVNETLHVLKLFGECSGLKINKDKTEAMLLGPWQNRHNLPRNIKWTNGPIKYLGIYISAKPNEIVMLNFQSKLEALLRQLHWWKARDLSLKGKVLIVKALGISKFQYLASLITIPQDIVKQVNTLIYNFIWNGNTDKVKRIIFEQEYKKGGYNMTNLNEMIISSSVMWVKKYLDNTDREWKNTLELLSKTKNFKLFLMSNFDLKELPASLPEYYLNAIKTFSEVIMQPTTIEKNCLWYNKNIKIGTKSVYNERLMSLGLWVVGDIFDENGVIPFETWLQRGAVELDRLAWYGIVNCVKKNGNYRVKEVNSQPLTILCGITLRSNFIEVGNIIPKQVKMLIKEKRFASLDTGGNKYRIKHENFHGSLSDKDWENIFSVLHCTPVSNRMKDLQYKIIMRFVPTNRLLYKMQKVTSQRCSFCLLETETIEHLFFDCNLVKNIWLFIFSEWQRVTGHVFIPTLQHCILGVYDHSVKFCAEVNVIILLVKSYIMKCKYDGAVLSNVAICNIFRSNVQLLNEIHKNNMFLPLLLMCPEL